MVFRGGHLLHHRSRVQARVALSSVEDALHSLIRGLPKFCRLQHVMDELLPAACKSLPCFAEEDSTACKGIILRHGVGQLKHLATRTMWAQQILQQEGIEDRRISRAVNSADCFASHNSSQDLHRAVDQIGGVWPGAQLECFLQLICT